MRGSRAATAVMLFLLTLTISGCGSGDTKAAGSATRDLFAMDTYMSILCCGVRCEAAADAAVSEIKELDAMLSVGNPDSEISILNRTETAVLSEAPRTMLKTALYVWEETGGAFDVTVLPLMQLWGFTDENYRVPRQPEIDALMKQAGSDRLTFDPESGEVTLGEGQGIDLGGIAKGYTSDRLMALFKEYGLDGGLVSLGGNVQCMGLKQDGSKWHLGIEDPDQESDRLIGVIEGTDIAVITSGTYERYFEADGRTWHHILDMSTGYPAESDLISVTIVSPDGMLADALSTACFVLGLERAQAFWRTHSDLFDMVLVTEDHKVYCTQPLSTSFTSEYHVNIIDKGVKSPD